MVAMVPLISPLIWSPITNSYEPDTLINSSGLFSNTDSLTSTKLLPILTANLSPALNCDDACVVLNVG